MFLNDASGTMSHWANAGPNWPSKVPNHPSGPDRTNNPPRPGKG